MTAITHPGRFEIVATAVGDEARNLGTVIEDDNCQRRFRSRWIEGPAFDHIAARHINKPAEL